MGWFRKKDKDSPEEIIRRRQAAMQAAAQEAESRKESEEREKMLVAIPQPTFRSGIGKF